MRWLARHSRLLACSLILTSASAAEAQVLRFSTTAPGKIVGIGNTLGLSKALNENGPGTRDSIGTFLSLGNTVDDMPPNPANPWPAGTTYDWTLNGSTAVLALPSEGTVLYAELVWGGSTSYGGDDVTALLGTPVTLTAGNTSITVSPDPITALTIAQQASGFAANYYMRSANVTAFVTAAGSATYSVSGVPATQATTINSLNAAGWTLAVAVRDPSAPIRNLSVFVGGSFVDENSQQDYAVSGFCTPPAGEVNGAITISAIEGDANLVGDQLLIAPTAAGPFVGLSGPNNPADNFFCSQINDGDGQLDTQGTSGTANHDALLGVNVSGGRQGWDVTTVPLSSLAGQLENGQTSAVLRTITTGDSYAPIMAAFAIDVNAPDFSGGGSMLAVAPSTVTIGDDLAVTLDLANTGQVTAQQVLLMVPLEAGLSLTSIQMDGQSGDINGNPVDGAKLAAGVDAGDLGAGETRHVVLSLDVVGPPAAQKYLVESTWSYGFQVCAGGATLPETYQQLGLVSYEEPPATTSSSGSGGSGGSASNGAGASGGGDSGAGGHGESGGGTVAEAGGCGCSVPGDVERPWLQGILGLAAAAALARSRRRRALG